MDWCKQHPDTCKEGSVLYKIHNEPLADIITISNVITVGIAWLLAKYFAMSMVAFVILAILMIAASIYIHKKVGMQTAEGRFFGVTANAYSS